MVTNFKRSPLKKTLRMRSRSLANGLLVLAVLAAIPFALWHQMRDTVQPAFSGIVEADAENVGPVIASRVLSIEVVPGQRVKPGDVLVRFDPSEYAMERAVNETKLREYEQSVARYEQDQTAYRQNLRESERRCRQIVREATVALEEQKMNQARDEAELKGYRAEMERLQPLVEKRLVSELDLASLRPRAEALEQTFARYAPLIASLQKRVEQAENDLKDVSALLADAEKGVSDLDSRNEASIAIREAAERCMTASQKDTSVLCAVSGGVVSQVFRQVGDVVAAGDPILRISSDTGTISITGMLPLTQIDSVRCGDVLRVSRLGQAAGVAGTISARVEALSPEVLDFFDPFNPAPRLPVRGRKVRLSLVGDPPSKLVPGEAVRLSSLQPETCWQGVKRICMGR